MKLGVEKFNGTSEGQKVQNCTYIELGQVKLIIIFLDGKTQGGRVDLNIINIPHYKFDFRAGGLD